MGLFHNNDNTKDETHTVATINGMGFQNVILHDNASNMTSNCVANDSTTNDTPFGSLMDETETCVVNDVVQQPKR